MSAPTQSRAPGQPDLFGRLPQIFAGRFEQTSAWSLLDTLNDLLEELPSEQIESRMSPDVYLSGDKISIGKGARIAPGAVLEGPIRIGEDVEIRPGAYLRGGVWIGDGCTVGANSEIKHSILLDGAKAPHLNYVGDSILGAEVNLGAGTILSNFRHDGAEVTIGGGDGGIRTGRRKLGAVLGDRVNTGCNSVLHPGVVVGRDTDIYPGVQLRSGVYPSRVIIKLRQEIEIIERRQ